MCKYLCNYNQMGAKNKYIKGKTNSNLLLTNVISKQIIYYFICKLHETLSEKELLFTLVCSPKRYKC